MNKLYNKSLGLPELDVAEIQAEADAILSQNGHQDNCPHSEVLNQILEELAPVDFREEAHLDPSEKITVKVLVVVVVQHILRVATILNVGLCRHSGFFYSYDGAFWKLIDPDELKMFLGQAAERLGVDEIIAKYWSFRDSLKKQFDALAYLAAPEPPQGTVLMNLLNGTYEICGAQKMLRGFRRGDFLCHQLPFCFDENASCPKWTAFLSRVLPDLSCQRVLAEFFAYIFTNLKLEKTLVLFGTGANGKSVVFDVLSALLGPSNIAHFSFHSLTSEYNRACLGNKLLNYASEISSKLESDIFKKLSSGEPVEARLPYGQPFIIRRYAKLAVNCNELPKDVEHHEAFFRRFLIIPFPVVIPEEERNPKLASEIIAEELPGVFNWLLEGLDRLLAQNCFSPCEAAKNALIEYRKESDSVALFVEEFGYEKVFVRQDAVRLSRIYDEFRSFCVDNGFRAVSSTVLRRRLQSLGFECERINVGQLVYAKRRSC
jgi:putative DNA primase/helicase